MKCSNILAYSFRLRKIFIVLLFVAFCPLTLQAQPKNKDLAALIKTRNVDTIKMLAGKLTAEAKKNHDQVLESKVVYQLSKMAYRQGDVASALDLARKSVKLNNQKDSTTYCQASLMIAYMFKKQGNNVEALAAAFKILRETEAHGWKKQNTYALICIADLYRETDNNSKGALPYALKASKQADELKDSSTYIIALSNLSNIYGSKELRSPANLAKAIKYSEIILSPPYVHLITPFDLARFTGNLGLLYEGKNDKHAEELMQQSVAISHEHKYTTLEKNKLRDLMKLYNKQGRYKEAIDYGHQAIAIEPGSENDKELQGDLFNWLSESYQGVGNYKLGLLYFQKSVALKDSISDITKTNDAVELDKKYRNDERLIIADNETKLFHQQRNYLILLAILIAMALIGTYYWLVSKRKREAALLIKEREQLEKLDALKTRFFANISHELRTPLTLIMGPAGQLLEKDIDDEAQEKHYLKTIINNGNKLLNLVNELLDLGKLQAGKLQLKLKPVALSAFIKVMYQGFTSAAAYKQINYILISVIDEQLFTDLDKEKFEKISNNLISNAIKFTPSGGSITVTAATTTDTINFSVANTGAGVHPDDLPNVFDRYYQGHNEEQQLQGGTGIGLAIVREFTELMGGSISIDNVWQESVTFKVSIPLVNPELRVMENPAVIEIDMPYVVPASGDKTLVMIVEDNHEMARYIADVLNPTHTLVVANNGIEALNMLNTMQALPQLIISDVMMPEMDGFTLLETLKQSDTFCTIPVIMLTALTDNQHKLKALNIGVDDYLTKPFLTDELIARVTNLISNATARFEVSTSALTELSDSNNEPAIEAEETEVMRVSPSDLVWLSELEAEVRKHVGKTDLNLYMLSDAIAISERQLFRRIKAITGLTPNKYIRTIRLQIAREAIESGRYRTIAEVSYVAGFDTPAYFAKLFKEYYGRDVGELL